MAIGKRKRLLFALLADETPKHGSSRCPRDPGEFPTAESSDLWNSDKVYLELTFSSQLTTPELPHGRLLVRRAWTGGKTSTWNSGSVSASGLCIARLLILKAASEFGSGDSWPLPATSSSIQSAIVLARGWRSNSVPTVSADAPLKTVNSRSGLPIDYQANSPTGIPGVCH
jgi:hypothetical protein